MTGVWGAFSVRAVRFAAQNKTRDFGKISEMGVRSDLLHYVSNT